MKKRTPNRIPRRTRVQKTLQKTAAKPSSRNNRRSTYTPDMMLRKMNSRTTTPPAMSGHRLQPSSGAPSCLQVEVRDQEHVGSRRPSRDHLLFHAPDGLHRALQVDV